MDQGTFWSWWQYLPQQISPVIFQIGNFKLQYYGLMYILAFATTYFMARYRIARESRFNISPDQVQEITTAMILGLVIGARLGYVLFYQPGYYSKHPLEIILPFQFGDGLRFTGISGMSYHGGLIGTLVATWIYSRKAKISYRVIGDLFAPVIPLGYTFGRIGNFINGELYGRATQLPFGMYFPLAQDGLLRHPSQLYEALFEGVLLFAVMWQIRRITKPAGAMLAFYLIGYGSIRFFIEFVRSPDEHLGFVVSFFSMGQVLCTAMIMGGIILYMGLQRMAQPAVAPPAAGKVKRPKARRHK